MATALHKVDTFNEAQEIQGDASEDTGPGAEDSVGIYLHDIGTIPLLSSEEEQHLTRVIDQGRQAAQRHEQALSSEERAAVLLEIEEGEAARRKMIESNLRLVVSIASRYNGRGLPLSDLIEEGNLGLIRAIEKFDYRRGYKFSTYAVWWIRQAITRGLDTYSRTVRLPGHILERLNHVTKATQKLTQELGRTPTNEEIAAAVSLSPEQVRDVMKASQRTVSLEQPYGEGAELPLSETIEDEGWEQTSSQVSNEMLRERVFAALRELSDREQLVISLRFGLNDEKRCTLEEAGKVLGVTRERIRQIEKEAIAKLRDAGKYNLPPAALQEVA